MRAVSWFLHPLLMPSLLFVILFYFAPLVIKPLPDDTFPLLLLVIVLTTFIVPLVSVIMLKSTNFISSYQMEDRKERILPFTFITIFYFITATMFLINSTVNSIFVIIFSTIAVTVLILTVINFFLKVSIHSAGMAGLVGFVLAIGYKFPGHQLLLPVVCLILIAGLVMSARLFLNSHNPKEVLVGSVLGFSVCFLAVIVFA